MSSDLFFHYTTSEAALSILRNNRLRFTHLRYLNDTGEEEYGLDTIRTAISQSHGEAQKRADAGYEAWRARAENPEFGTFAHPSAVACFSREGDGLTMWRAYGKPGDCYSLGFDAGVLRDTIQDGLIAKGDDTVAPLSNIRPVEWMECLYLNVRELQTHLGLDASEFPSLADDPKGGESMQFDLERVKPALKHRKFKDEREVRLIKCSSWIAPYELRTGAFAITPYWEAQFNKSALREITVGPGPHLETAKRGVESALRKYDYENVRVNTTEIPFRDW